VASATGTVVAVVRRYDDVEDRVVVTADGQPAPSHGAIDDAIAFQERWFDAEVLTA
jgi:hypothetical protein